MVSPHVPGDVARSSDGPGRRCGHRRRRPCRAGRRTRHSRRLDAAAGRATARRAGEHRGAATSGRRAHPAARRVRRRSAAALPGALPLSRDERAPVRLDQLRQRRADHRRPAADRRPAGRGLRRRRRRLVHELVQRRRRRPADVGDLPHRPDRALDRRQPADDLPARGTRDRRAVAGRLRLAQLRRPSSRPVHVRRRVLRWMRDRSRPGGHVDRHRDHPVHRVGAGRRRSGRDVRAARHGRAELAGARSGDAGDQPARHADRAVDRRRHSRSRSIRDRRIRPRAPSR